LIDRLSDKQVERGEF